METKTENKETKFLKAYLYRMYPTKVQEKLLSKHFGCTRLVYNKALEFKKRLWEEKKENISCFGLCKELTKWKQTEDYSFLYEASNAALQQSIRHLDSAYVNFFNKGGYPKFKSKKGKQSYSIPEKCSISFEKKVIFIPLFREGIKIRIDRVFKGKVKTCTVKRATSGEYFVSVLVETNDVLPIKPQVKKESTVGVDVGIKNFCTLSNGTIIKNPRFLSSSLGRLRILQKRASKKEKGSRNRKKANVKVAKYYEGIVNRRKDFLHKLTYRLTHDSQISTICMETLDISSMMKKESLARGIQDASWNEFKKQLKYKCEWYGKNLLFVEQFFPSSKTCSNCGNINQGLTLFERTWTCPLCGCKHDRDLNAAVNIKNKVLSYYLSGSDESVELVESLSLERTMKQEEGKA